MKIIGYRVYNKTFGLIFESEADAENYAAQFGVTTGFFIEPVYAIPKSC